MIVKIRHGERASNSVANQPSVIDRQPLISKSFVDQYDGLAYGEIEPLIMLHLLHS